jgi:hypothetical protein
MMEAVSTLETSVNFCEITRRKIPADKSSSNDIWQYCIKMAFDRGFFIPAFVYVISFVCRNKMNV